MSSHVDSATHICEMLCLSGGECQPSHSRHTLIPNAHPWDLQVINMDSKLQAKEVQL